MPLHSKGANTLIRKQIAATRKQIAAEFRAQSNQAWEVMPDEPGPNLAWAYNIAIHAGWVAAWFDSRDSYQALERALRGALAQDSRHLANAEPDDPTEVAHYRARVWIGQKAVQRLELLLAARKAA